MKVCIQDPSWPDSVYLLEEILEACVGASHGAGIFAFASAGGVRLLLHDPAFKDFLSQSTFELVVGLDAVTDTAALDALNACVAADGRLKVRVFLGDSATSLFHAKMCWFRHPKQSIWLVGSGNLTAGGLRGNCEAFTATKLDQPTHATLENEWSSWLKFHDKHLFPVDHPEVRKRALQNSGIEQGVGGKRRPVIVEEPGGNISVGVPQTSTAAVLIAEIPRSGNRWNQANFDLDTFQNFFGASPGRTQRIILTHIGSDGRTGSQEVRPSVAVSSQNYRFELEAAAGLPYPDHGRPIAIFVRIATRTFRYRLLMPGTRLYGQANRFLRAHSTQVGTHVRRFVTSLKALRGAPFLAGLADISNRQE
jgi:hypothetical protein